MTMEKQNLPIPTVTELFSEDIQTAFKNEQLNLLLNQEPKKEWIKEHPNISGYRYLPIDKIEFMLRKIFKKYRIEVLKTGMLLNAVEVTVRVWYLSPTTNEMEYHDGVGACEIQTKKESGSLKLDMSNINRGAVVMALPIAKTVAIKDACDHFGKLFGCDLNRKNTLTYSLETVNVSTPSGVDPEIEEQFNIISDIESLEKYVAIS